MCMNFERKVDYTKPEHSDPVNFFKHHKFEIKKGENVVSAAEVRYFAQPVPHYQVSDIYTEPFYQNQGLASQILSTIESFLEQRGKPGVLVDAIMSDEPKVKSMYERRGWRLIDGDSLRVYNLPDDIDPGSFKGYGVRGANVG